MQTSNGYKSLLILYISLLFGQLIFLGISFFMVKQQMFNKELADIENILMVLEVLLVLICMISGQKIFKVRVEKLNELKSLSAKLTEYRVASLIRWALMEGSCLFAIICFMLTSNYLFMLIAVLVLFFFAGISPVKSKVASDMGITVEELDTIS